MSTSILSASASLVNRNPKSGAAAPRRLPRPRTERGRAKLTKRVFRYLGRQRPANELYRVMNVVDLWERLKFGLRWA